MKSIKKLLFILMSAAISFAFFTVNVNAQGNKKIPILLYHNVVNKLPPPDEYNYEYITTTNRFDENIETLLDNGYNIIPLEELYKNRNNLTKLPNKSIVITFDDGYLNQYRNAFPVIKKYGIRASMFVCTDFLNKSSENSGYFNWNQARIMKNSGLVDIYSHGKRHIMYSTISNAQFLKEINESITLIDNKLGKNNINVFAYPYGDYTKNKVNLLNNNNIQMQLYDVGVNTAKDFSFSYVKRIEVSYYMTGKDIIKYINNN